MDELYQQIKKIWEDGEYSTTSHLKKVVADAVIACLKARPVVTSSEIMDSIIRLSYDGIIDEDLALSDSKYQNPAGNRHLNQEGLLHAILHATVNSIVKGWHPGLETHVYYSSNSLDVSGTGISSTMLFYSDGILMREYISPKLTQISEGNYLFQA